MSSKKRVVILGSTGSIGESALKVARDIPDRMEVVGLAAGRSAQALLSQAAEFKPRAVALYDTTELDAIRGHLPPGTACHGGPEGLIALATMPEATPIVPVATAWRSANSVSGFIAARGVSILRYSSAKTSIHWR